MQSWKVELVAQGLEMDRRDRQKMPLGTRSCRSSALDGKDDEKGEGFTCRGHFS